MRKLGVLWRSAGLLMAIDSREVVEVLAPVLCRPAPGTPEWLRGLFNYRGGLIPLVDAAVLLGAPRAPDRMANRVIVTGSTSNASGGTGARWLFAIWVESVLEIDHIDFEAPDGHPGFATDAARFLGPVAQTRWGKVQLVRAEEIFDAEQIRILSERLTEATA